MWSLPEAWTTRAGKQRLWAPPTAIPLVSFQLECPWVQDTCSNMREAPSVASPLRTLWHPSTLVWCPYFIYDCFSPWIISTHVGFLLEKIFIISIYSFLTYFLALCKILYKFCFQGICWGTSLVVQWLRIHLPMHGTWVQSLVRKLRSHMSGATKVGCCNYWAHMLWSPCSTAREAASSHNKRLTCHN